MPGGSTSWAGARFNGDQMLPQLRQPPVGMFTRFGDVIIRGTSVKRRRLREVDGKHKAREIGPESVRHADRAVHGAGRS